MILSQILIKISSIIDAIPKLSLQKARYLSAFPVVSLSKPLLGFSFLIFCSCSTTKTGPIETIKEIQVHDTIVLHDVRFDSIYIASNHSVDRGKDTVIIQDQQIEYRYRLLRDTIRITKVEIQRDSIPYGIRVETIKEIPRKRNLIDIIAYLCMRVILVSLAYWIYHIFRKL